MSLTRKKSDPATRAELTELATEGRRRRRTLPHGGGHRTKRVRSVADGLDRAGEGQQVVTMSTTRQAAVRDWDSSDGGREGSVEQRRSMLRAASVLSSAPPPPWPARTTSVPPGARAVCPQLQIMPQPSTRTRRHRSSEHGQHRRRHPGPAVAQDTQPRLVRTPQPAPKLALARTSHVCDSCPVSDPPGHRPCFRWLLGRQSRRLPGSGDGLGS